MTASKKQSIVEVSLGDVVEDETKQRKLRPVDTEM